MSVEELAWRLNVSHPYARKLLHVHALRPICILHRKRYVWRQAAEAYCRKRRARARHALRELARISQDAGLYRA